MGTSTPRSSSRSSNWTPYTGHVLVMSHVPLTCNWNSPLEPGHKDPSHVVPSVVPMTRKHWLSPKLTEEARLDEVPGDASQEGWGQASREGHGRCPPGSRTVLCKGPEVEVL